MSGIDELRAIVERDREWEPSCQFIKADASTAKVIGHPWPLTVALADAYGRLCNGKRRHHPATFVGKQWDHAEFVYDPAEDRAPHADRRALLTLLREVAEEHECFHEPDPPCSLQRLQVIEPSSGARARRAVEPPSRSVSGSAGVSRPTAGASAE